MIRHLASPRRRSSALGGPSTPPGTSPWSSFTKIYVWRIRLNFRNCQIRISEVAELQLSKFRNDTVGHRWHWGSRSGIMDGTVRHPLPHACAIFDPCAARAIPCAMHAPFSNRVKRPLRAMHGLFSGRCPISKLQKWSMDGTLLSSEAPRCAMSGTLSISEIPKRTTRAPIFELRKCC